MNKRYEDPYSFDLDDHEMMRFTKKNIDFIEAILRVDSTYKQAETGSEGSAQWLFDKYKITQEPDVLTKQVEALNRENSTHLQVVEGGVQLTVESIRNIKDLEKRLKERDVKLVNEIASAVPGRNNFSFATKYCTFASRYSFEKQYNDGYCIYDKVLEQVIPYYVWHYFGERFIKRKSSILESEIREKKDYETYIGIIDEIIEAAGQEEGYKVKHKEFDHIIWYAYKGNESSRKALVAEKINNTPPGQMRIKDEINLAKRTNKK